MIIMITRNFICLFFDATYFLMIIMVVWLSNNNDNPNQQRPTVLLLVHGHKVCQSCNVSVVVEIALPKTSIVRSILLSRKEAIFLQPGGWMVMMSMTAMMKDGQEDGLGCFFFTNREKSVGVRHVSLWNDQPRTDHMSRYSQS